MKRIISLIPLFVLWFVPLFVLAAPATFKDLVGAFAELFNVIVPLIFALAMLVFLWGVFRYMFFPDSEENKTKGRQVIMWGIVVFVVMASIWGIAYAIYSTFYLGTFNEYCIRTGECYQ